MHRFFISLFVWIVTASSVFSAVEYDNFAPGNIYSQNSGFSISSQYRDASAFTASFTGTLTSIDFGVTAQMPGNHDFNVSIALDAGGQPAGSATFLGMISPTAGFNGPGSDRAIVSLTNLSYSLTIGAVYWIELSAAGPNDGGVWNLSTVATTPQMLQSSDGGLTWSNPGLSGIGAFRVNASVVPEPTTVALLGSAFGMCLLIERSRRRR
jgi:hypothetical protein